MLSLQPETDFSGVHEAIVFDLETTGLAHWEGDRIISVALLHVFFPNSEIRNVQYAVVNPQRPIPDRASAKNGFYDRDVKGKPPFSSIAADIRHFIGELPLIAYNAKFDVPFLESELSLAGVSSVSNNRILCPMLRFQDHVAGNSRAKLEEVVDYFGIAPEQYHEAYGDAVMAYRVAERFYRMDNRLGAA